MPGNHDCQRQWIIEHQETYGPIVNQNFTEDRFNNMLNEQSGRVFWEKFANNKSFVEQYLPNAKQNLIGFSVENSLSG